MKGKNAFRTLVFGCLIVLLLSVGLLARPTSQVKGDNVFRLQAPSFLGAVQAQEASLASLIGDEAGIAAYFNAGTAANLATVRSAYRTIEVETADYIIGSIAVADYPESEDVHVYVHRDGWFMAYYLAADPVAKIFDWKSYNGSAIGTKLEKTLAIAASGAGVPFSSATYYDFRYPNANRLMLIAETGENGNDFSVTLPSSFVYYERSWGVIGNWNNSGWDLDGVRIGGCDYCTGQGFLSAAQLAPAIVHTVSVWNHGGLALVYRVP